MEGDGFVFFFMPMYEKHQLGDFTVRPYRSKHLKEYCARMSQDNLGILVDDRVKSVLEAQGFTAIEAPRSIYKVDKLYQALQGYAPKKIPNYVSDEDTKAGLSLAYSCFARKHDQVRLEMLPFTPETVDLITSNKKGSAGLTRFGERKADSQVHALERGIQTLKKQKQPEPCIAFKRTQFNDKTRLVWGYPYSMTAVEGLIAWPLIQKFKRGTTPMAFAMTTGALGAKLRTSSYHKEWAYSLDMSQFDATIGAKLIHQAFNILRTWYDLEQVEPVSGMLCKDVFNLVEYYFINTTIVMPDSQLYIGKDHGVPSGSYFTQLIDSIVNVIICGSISSRFNLHVDKNDIFVLGDDILFWSNRKISLDAIAEYASQKFHIKVHGSEKSALYHYDEKIHFLGRDWENGLPTLSIPDILSRMVYPETFRKYSKDPEAAERQVRMMLLSYAAIYRDAWRIAYKCIDPSDSFIHNGCANTDVNVYMNGVSEEDFDPDHMSGLQRYQMKYVFNERESNDIPITALQYWL